jgi:hypothetical protein
MGLRGRYFSPRDIRLVNSLNNELLDDIIENIVEIFKVAPYQTVTNIYGETSPTTGKAYYAAVKVSALIDRPEMSAEDENFGPDRNQNHVFKFLEPEMKRRNFYPEIGDLVFWNDRYYEIDNVVQEQLLAGVPEKSHSIICSSHYTALSNLNIVPRQQ